jgi:hypothetical protein
VDLDTSRWSGEGEFTQVLVERLRLVPQVRFLRVEDAPATRSEADYNFISNEVYVDFVTQARRERTVKWGLVPVHRAVAVALMDLTGLEATLTLDPMIGAPDYADEGMLQYLRSARIVPPYQTRGYKMVELVRIYQTGREPRRP